jgi:hypothetical protein
MSETCPECGAVLPEGSTCQSIFDEFLALEFTDPAYGEVHFLTVACFMIQHGRYSDAALTWIGQKLRAYLEEGEPIGQIRQQAASEAGPQVRTWKVMRQTGERPLPRIAWSVTIMDVANHFEEAASYREWVTRWARATLQEMKLLL